MVTIINLFVIMWTIWKNGWLSLSLLVYALNIIFVLPTKQFKIRSHAHITNSLSFYYKCKRCHTYPIFYISLNKWNNIIDIDIIWHFEMSYSGTYGVLSTKRWQCYCLSFLISVAVAVVLASLPVNTGYPFTCGQ